MPENYLMIMIQSLKKKIEVLDCIIDADERQKIGLEDPSLDPDDFDKIVEEKAKYIEHLDLLDQGFDKLFERVKDQLNDNRELYKDEIKEMQTLITTVTEKSNKIQVQEARNKELMTQKFAKVHKQARDVRASQQAVNQYYQNMKKLNYIDPQFMDNKK
ncbi:MAG: flagellar protein FliT [Roseburia sp.]|nr:flagellar protein FliT [Roseburia sp.]